MDTVQIAPIAVEAATSMPTSPVVVSTPSVFTTTAPNLSPSYSTVLSPATTTDITSLADWTALQDKLHGHVAQTAQDYLGMDIKTTKPSSLWMYIIIIILCCYLLCVCSSIFASFLNMAR